MVDRDHRTHAGVHDAGDQVVVERQPLGTPNPWLRLDPGPLDAHAIDLDAHLPGQLDVALVAMEEVDGVADPVGGLVGFGVPPPVAVR